MLNKFGVFKICCRRLVSLQCTCAMFDVAIKILNILIIFVPCGHKGFWDSQHATVFHRNAMNQQKAQI